MKTHEMSDAEILRVLYGMRQRCKNPHNSSYKYYGGRGISICDEWDSDTRTFVKWARGNGCASGLTIERKNVNGDYCPENCMWATREEQSKNRRDVELYEGKTAVEWSRELGMSAHTIRLQKRKYSLSLGEVIERYKHREGFALFTESGCDRNLVYEGKTQNEWACELGVSHQLLRHYRKAHNCSLGEAVEHYQKSRATDKEA